MPEQTKVSSSYCVNELGEVVASRGEGSFEVKGFLPTTVAPVDSDGRMKIAGMPLPSIQNNTVLFIGTSLVQQNDIGTSTKISHWSRGWISWLRFYMGDRMFSPVWWDDKVYVGWEPSGVAGSTRGFMGMNAGVSGQFIDQILARKEFIVKNIKPKIVFLDGGTNDMGTLSKESIQAKREELAKYLLKNGIIVVLLPILARGISSWVPGQPERPKAAWINAQTRAFVQKNDNCYLFDWNRYWVDTLNANGAPLAGYSNDDIHFSIPGGESVGFGASVLLKTLLPPVEPSVWSQDDVYNATNNPLGNLLTNPFCIGTTGTATAPVTGSVATSMRVEKSGSGTATCVASKQTRTDNRGEWQVLTITPAAVETLFYYRTNSADTSHTYAAGTWVQASIEVDIGAHADWQGVSLYLKDNGTNGLIAYGMETYDNSGLVKLPNKNMVGKIYTPPIKIVSGSTTLRWRVEVRVAGNASPVGNAVVKIGAIELREVANPQEAVGYVGL